MSYRRYVALGDSCAEGLDDPYPDGGFRGWADLTAARLAAREPDLHYANLAVRGRRLDQVRAEQVPAAVALRPDLVAMFAGGNDVLQGKWRIGAVAANLDATVRALTEVARTVVLFTLPDLARRLPGLRWLRPRTELLNDLIRATAARHGALLVDVRRDPWAEDLRLYGADRLHLGEIGHRRVAGHLLTALGLPADDWLAPLPPAEREAYWRSTARHWQWVRCHVVPAIRDTARNRFTGRQPGDGHAPKRPDLGPF
jgi:lysophospholipase L1-like esterase